MSDAIGYHPRFWQTYGRSILAGTAYGVAIRLFFLPGNARLLRGLPHWFQPGAAWVMTIGFLAVVPFTAGWISLGRWRHDGSSHWARWILTPWIAVLLCDGFLLSGAVEGWICVLFSLPITLAFASLGGILAGIGARNRVRSRGVTTTCLAMLPLLLAAVETNRAAPVKIREVHTERVIMASRETVWRNVERVPAIDPAELRRTWTHAVGFPLPVEATLDHEGVGGVRHASFAGGLLFVETIDRWEPMHRLGFKIAADTAHIPPTTLDEHVTIGGPYFDVLDGEYRLEPLPNGGTLLHLISHERISTDFNAYASLWTDAVMRDLQESILDVVKHRCERGYVPVSGSANLNQ